MSDEERKRMLITPPPGLLPPVPTSTTESEALNTGSGTRRIVVPRSSSSSPSPSSSEPETHAPAFFPTVPGLPVPGVPAPGAPAGALDTAAPPVRETAAWALVLSDGARHEIPATGIVIGRNPVPPRSWPEAVSLAIDDPEKTVSKTHAVVFAAEGGVTVIDLKSTNGTGVVDEGVTRSVSGETRVDHDVAVVFGSYPVELARG